MTRVNSWNEWDRLKHVIVGRIDSRMVGAPDAGMVLDFPELGLKPGQWTPIPDSPNMFDTDLQLPANPGFLLTKIYPSLIFI